MNLDKRMSAILSEIPTGKNLADIGADHGYIGITYAQNNLNNIVVGSDISEKSIQKAKLTAKKLGLNNYFTIVGNGLVPIQNYDIDVILISGMGGEEIIKIINNKKIYPYYILSPQKNADKVRVYLSEKNLKPIKDYKVKQGDKFYDIMVCTAGKYIPSQFELLYGSGEGVDFAEFAKLTKDYLSKLLDNVTKTADRDLILHKIEVLESKNNKVTNES